ncbi:LOW QUALITY PROTEIN: NADH dehydrogenase [ubiquinone] 1 beta subcomplex subunit 6 [Arvicola amphibius]|uniref:LOW QUALITY PROTEIN: NADH dehydrogenase [ubiquinone] 1 beta subcomplex subunit 6 n=1 Tax=Arvicola amphibius TaxID=1047088 RepID=UPI0018E29D40|nr:LOW QUALITY PROTEIN: NADH dehydrogenase [ubiquinone] 1 beta subcomplex subunit 6 [Arvicola amphibius]
MTGYTPDEKLRLQQLRELRRRWLKDQELSPREPVLPPAQDVGPWRVFWNNFLRDGAGWKKVIFKTYRSSIFTVSHILVPLWFIHYYVKYHVATKPYGIVDTKPRIFPGDTILETGEVIPPMKDFPDQHH